jgi:nitrite reductase/ring-hydroxylating ferredoxin subunit
MTWRTTGVNADELAEGAMRGTTVGASPIVLARVAGTVVAVDGSCPHIGGELADGTVELGKLICPLHGATFDLLTGAVRADPFGVVPPEGGTGPLTVYPVRIAGGTVEVDLPEV